MSVNCDDVLRQLSSFGLIVDGALVIGKRERCKVDKEKGRPGWYHLHELQTTGGESLIVGSFGIWHGDDNNAQKVLLDKTSKLSKEQSESLRNRIKEDRRASDAAREAQAIKAGDVASKLWKRLDFTGESAYLQRKAVQGHGVRYSPKTGAIAIPLQDTQGRIHGLQIIRSPKARLGGGLDKEFFPVGCVSKGHFFLIGTPGNVLLIAEGYATAATLHEATGLPVAVAFDAGNILPVCRELKKHYRHARQLICADDDIFRKCLAKKDGEADAEGRPVLCRAPYVLTQHPTHCPTCSKEHQGKNPGCEAASAAALECGGAWLRPLFAENSNREQLFFSKGAKLSDFNDLHVGESLAAVRAQVENKLLALHWSVQQKAASLTQRGSGAAPLRPITSVDELMERFSLVYGMGGVAFDAQEHMLVALSDIRDACAGRWIAKHWHEHPEKSVVRKEQVGFDPTGLDAQILCNLWGGWPTTPKAGKCDKLLDLLRHMCSNDRNRSELFDWVIKWIAYPLQHPGAKMKTCLVLHGPQGAGKNMFFEVVMCLYGCYGRVIGQDAIEDKFNDYASRKLFLIADEVVARSDLYHVKNKLKAFITGDWIRINSKNMAAYDERNHVNLVFLSNEVMPVVLDEDDRRHCVIYTPGKQDAEFYREVLNEIKGGGAEALHDYLLHLDLGSFDNATLPPQNQAKVELIEQSRDSTSRFLHALQGGDILGKHKLGPALSEHVFDLYCAWCNRLGLRPAPLPKLVAVLKLKHQIPCERKRYRYPADADLENSPKGPHGCLYLGDLEQPLGQSEVDWLGECFDDFYKAVGEYKGTARA